MSMNREETRAPLRTIVVDDESLARRGLKLRLGQLPEVDLVAECWCSWTSRCRAWTGSTWSGRFSPTTCP